MFNISSKKLRYSNLSINKYSKPLTTYLLTLILTFYVLMILTVSSLTYTYYLVRYSYAYYMYISSIILFILYTVLHLLIPKYSLIRDAAIISSITLAITNYSYLITYKLVNQLTMHIYPLVIIVTDKASNSVALLDWGQIALVTLILLLLKLTYLNILKINHKRT